MDGKKPCPLCKTQDFTVMYNKGLERSLAQLLVRCSNRKHGCEWTGELRQYEKHLGLDPEPDDQLQGCKYVELKCIYVCGGWFLRGAIARHQKERCPQRPFCCDYCRDYNSVHADVVYRHWPVCKCYPMDCPNHCSMYAIERQHMQEHLQLECPLKMVECEFRSAGCDILVTREDMNDHLEEFHVQHTSMLAEANQKLQDELTERDEQIKQLLKTEVTKVKEDNCDKMDTLWLENAFLKQEMAQIRSEMTEMKQMFLDSLSQHKDTQDQREQVAKMVCDSLETEVAKLKSDLEESRVSLYQQCYSIQSYVGVFPVEFQMSQFSQYLQEKKQWQSPVFYSHLEGYRLCLLINPEERGKDNELYVSVFVCVLQGEYDDRLKWPVLAEVTVQLRNQLTDRHHATGVIRFTDMTPTRYSSRVGDGEGERGEEEGWGLKRFIGHSEMSYNSVKNRQYLKDDRLCFRLTKVQI